MDDIKEAKRLAQEAKDAVRAARQREKELALELRQVKKNGRLEERVEEFECNQQQKQIENVAKTRELEHRKLEAKERLLAKKEGKVVVGKRSATEALPVASPMKHYKAECSAASPTKQLSSSDGRIMPSPLGAYIGDGPISTLPQNVYEPVVD